MYRCLACGSRFPTRAPVCTYCWAAHSLALIADRPRAALDGEIELTTARELARAAWQDAAVPAYPGLTLRDGALVVLVGAAGSGKSTMVTRALDSLASIALLVSIEEPAGPSLADRLGRAGARDENLLVCSRASVDQLADLVRRRKVTALGIDSVQRATFEPRDLRHMLTVLPTLSIVFAVSQINRDGDVRGGEELAHECDVLLELEEMRWTVRKSRYQPAGASGDVLPPASPTEAPHVPA